MNIEPFDGAACAASDLTARLLAELVQANRQLADADEQFRVTATRAHAEGSPIPFRVRAHRTECRRQIAMLRQVLAGMPYSGGGCHVASA